MLQDDKKATEELMMYHSNERASDTKTASQFLFETGAQGSTTTEVGYGIRFGNHYATVVKYRTENEMVQEILDYPFDDDDNDDDDRNLRVRMVKLLHTLTGKKGQHNTTNMKQRQPPAHPTVLLRRREAKLRKRQAKQTRLRKWESDEV